MGTTAASLTGTRMDGTFLHTASVQLLVDLAIYGTDIIMFMLRQRHLSVLGFIGQVRRQIVFRWDGISVPDHECETRFWRTTAYSGMVSDGEK